MKNIIKYGIFALMSIFIMASCDPQDSSDYKLGAAPTTDELSFTVTPSAEAPNILILNNTSSRAGVAVWDLGNFSKDKGQEVKGEYPFKGEYTISMTLYGTGGSTTISKTITIGDDDFDLLDTEMYRALTGGFDDADGKTWVFDSGNDGHFGVGPASDTKPSWWSCSARGKAECSLYKQEFTFSMSKTTGLKLIWKNEGKIYTNEPGKVDLAKKGHMNATVPPAGDWDVEYTPAASYTFTMNEAAMSLILAEGAFFGHYTGNSSYSILDLDEDVLYLKVVSEVESGSGWWYRFIPKEKNIKPEIPLRAVALKEDFEGAKPTVAFVAEDMGSLFSQSYQNPAPVPINQSAKVCLYQKTDAFYSNLSYTAEGYKFDLSEINKVRMKVFIPSYNDYNTIFPVAGDWITVNKLQSQVVVRLQDSSNSSPGETQTEIVKASLEKDKWLDLEFDFSSVSSNTSYDKIIIQFGAEGHAAPGIFFFDDFSFNK